MITADDVSVKAHLKFLASLWPIVLPIFVAVASLWADVRAQGADLRGLQATVRATIEGKASADDLRRLERQQAEQAETLRRDWTDLRTELRAIHDRLAAVCARVKCRDE